MLKVKCNVFSYQAYKARKQLAAIDWNYHITLTKNSHMISYMKPEFNTLNEKFHIGNWYFTCEIKSKFHI